MKSPLHQVDKHQTTNKIGDRPKRLRNAIVLLKINRFHFEQNKLIVKFIFYNLWQNINRLVSVA